jgi:hypothetical protein
MAKLKIDNYSFDASEKKITFTDYTTIRLDSILLITNATDNIIIFNFSDANKGGTVATNVLTLTYSTTGMSDGDKLLIYYEDNTASPAIGAVKITDTAGVARGVLMEDGSITTRDYLVAIAEEEISSHHRFLKIGYTPSMTTGESDVWSKGGAYVFPTTAIQMQLSSDYTGGGATRDVGSVIKGNAEGANQTILCDASGSTTKLIDISVDFNAATAVAVGDCVLVSPKGDGSTAALTPEWGYVTAISTTTNANDTLEFSGGLSSGGTCAVARAYTVVDVDAYSGGQVVKIDYLNGSYAEKTILMCLNEGNLVTTKNAAGTNLTDLFRINSFKIVASGSGNSCTGNLWLESVGTARSGVVYSYITKVFTRARNAMYTVPAGKTLYINKFTAGYSIVSGSKWEYARIYLRTNREPSTQFKTNSIFYADFEIISNNSTVVLPLASPKKVIEKTDIKVSGIASAAGVAICSYRGWLETN